jgi:hypothetical protein
VIRRRFACLPDAAFAYKDCTDRHGKPNDQVELMGTRSRCFENNFAAGPSRKLRIANKPSRWELMLQSLEITESQVRILMKIPGSRRANLLRRWIERYHDRRFISTKFLS